jgi:hypothetical protein
VRLIGLRPCQAPEIEDYANYLLPTDKRDSNIEHAVGAMLLKDQATLSVGRLESLDELGGLRTFWGVLGEGAHAVYAIPPGPQAGFRVRWALDVMQRVHKPDHYDLISVAHHSDRCAAGDQPRILLYEDADGPYLLDGNHGAIGVYECGRRATREHPRPIVHILRTPPGCPLLVNERLPHRRPDPSENPTCDPRGRPSSRVRKLLLPLLLPSGSRGHQKGPF